MSAARIAIGSSVLADYPEAGGVWTWTLQYMLGLRTLGHDPFLVELLERPADPAAERRLRRRFFERLRPFGLEERALLLVHDSGSEASPDNVGAYSRSGLRLAELARSCDAVWNLAGALGSPLLALFRRRALVDVDPGMFQISALEWNMGLDDHDTFLTCGLRVGTAGCAVPEVGRTWHTFTPFVDLASWTASSPPRPRAAVTSVTNWTWDSDWTEWQGQRLSASKREAYLRYVDLPRRCSVSFKLAANIHPLDDTGDRELLRAHGWQLVHPDTVVRTPQRYASFISSSLAELCCCKPIYRQLRTGWISDRTVCYLAGGRPAICESTGFEDDIPVGDGLFAFDSIDEAAAAIAAIANDYERHSRAARALAEDVFDARRVLPRLVELTTDGP
ncbi:MAG TPA: hypothetical protein VF066_01095 [Thermoleophilaceae bacterium]